MTDEKGNAHFRLVPPPSVVKHDALQRKRFFESGFNLRIGPRLRRALGTCAVFSAKLGEGLALFGKLLQQRSGLPDFTMLALELGDAIINPFEANCCGIPHRTATMGREAIAVYINDVDI